MNENARKVFDMLGVEPNEKFKIEGNGDIIYYIDEKLYVYRDNEMLCSDKVLNNLKTGYFKIIKLPKKKKLRDLTPKEWDKWKHKNCNNCDKCIFIDIICGKSWNDSSWINHKDFYSNKFLDQEIEVLEE